MPSRDQERAAQEELETALDALAEGELYAAQQAVNRARDELSEAIMAQEAK